MAAALSRGMLQRISPVYAVLRDAAADDSALRGPLTADINRRCVHFQRTLAEIVHARGPFRRRPYHRAGRGDLLSPGQP